MFVRVLIYYIVPRYKIIVVVRIYRAICIQKWYIIKATNANGKKKLSLEKTNKFSLIPCWSFMSDSVNDPQPGITP